MQNYLEKFLKRLNHFIMWIRKSNNWVLEKGLGLFSDNTPFTFQLKKIIQQEKKY